MMQMEPVKSALGEWFKKDKNFAERYNQLKKELLNQVEIKQFLQANPQLSESDIERNMMKLFEYEQQSKQCDRCTCFADCTNTLQGYSPILVAEEQDIRLSYEKCPKRLQHEVSQSQERLVQSLYMPHDILGAQLENIDQSDPERTKAIVRTGQFLEQARTSLPARGIYYHGPFGVGKTYFLGAVANYLQELNYSSMIIYMPEFVREMKNSISDGTINEKIESFKRADVLMLDDLGAETQSAWFRDEILGSILQYRMMESLPMFFTSNFSLRELESELAVTRGKVEEVKAMRIIERIKQVSEVVEVNGKNRRV